MSHLCKVCIIALLQLFSFNVVLVAQDEVLLKKLDSVQNVLSNNLLLSSQERAKSLISVFVLKFELGQKDDMLYYLGEAENELEKISPIDKGPIYERIAKCYYALNNMDKAIAFSDLGYENALTNMDSIAAGIFYRDKALYANFANGSGVNGDYVTMMKKSLTYFRGKSVGKAEVLFRLAEVYYELDSIECAEGYHYQVLMHSDFLPETELKQLDITAYTAKKDYVKVDSLLYIQLETYIETQWLARIAFQYALLSHNSLAQGLTDQAIERSLMGYDFAVENDLTKERGDLLALLIKAYESSGDFENALYRTRELDSIMISFRDISEQLNQKDIQKKVAQGQVQKEKLLNDKKSLELKNKQNQQYFLFGGIGVFILLTFFAFRAYRQKRKDHILIEKQKKLVEIQRDEVELQKTIIEEVHKEITDSINYAERIQRSFLASEELLNENLNEYFVFFQPKEVVSGDFYWARKMADNQFTILNADSTGHGVPGAIMSIVNVSSIEWSVNKGLVKPADIFNSARKIIIDRLKMDGSEDGGKDGMDASLINIDTTNGKLQYVAANNPIWIIREGELIEIKGEKMPVGKHDNDHLPFLGGETDIFKGDLIYTLTDGFQDQFGGEKGKKFKIKPLKELLIKNAHLPLAEQKDILSNVFNSWMSDNEQIDDVCMIGVRI